jgi:hypothetical protein
MNPHTSNPSTAAIADASDRAVGTSRFRGVYWCKSRQKWSAQIQIDGQHFKLGRFDDEIAAAKAYDQFARDRLGVFAHLNFPTDADKARAVPLIDRHEACRLFGVTINTWWRWETEGQIQCGKRVALGRKLYRIDDIKRLLEENGSYSPPYPDPQSPGCYRVPLNSHDLHTREAIIDAQSLPLIEGGTCSWGLSTEDVGYISLSHPDVPKGTPLRRVIMGVVNTK